MLCVAAHCRLPVGVKCSGMCMLEHNIIKAVRHDGSRTQCPFVHSCRHRQRRVLMVRYVNGKCYTWKKGFLLYYRAKQNKCVGFHGVKCNDYVVLVLIFNFLLYTYNESGSLSFNEG